MYNLHVYTYLYSAELRHVIGEMYRGNFAYFPDGIDQWNKDASNNLKDYGIICLNMFLWKYRPDLESVMLYIYIYIYGIFDSNNEPGHMNHVNHVFSAGSCIYHFLFFFSFKLGVDMHGLIHADRLAAQGVPLPFFSPYLSFST